VGGVLPVKAKRTARSATQRLGRFSVQQVIAEISLTMVFAVMLRQ